jgi:hypothetical protein
MLQVTGEALAIVPDAAVGLAPSRQPTASATFTNDELGG